ncbi:MAG: hypothetical protein HC913_11335 [Microscillaceae bacterium]|nr:hypothetical protein [Microscillaceae bacterium]
MKKFVRFVSALFVYGRILSLDVVLGVILMALLGGHICHHPVEKVVLAALGLTVWLIYTLDHLLDAYQIPPPAHTLRHRFHQQYFGLLVFFWFLGAGLGLRQIAPFLPSEIWKRGLAMLVLVGGHFILCGLGARRLGILGKRKPASHFLQPGGIAPRL